MAEYLALVYSADVDWWAPEQADELAEYRQFAVQNADAIRASVVLHPTSTATVGVTVRRTGCGRTAWTTPRWTGCAPA